MTDYDPDKWMAPTPGGLCMAYKHLADANRSLTERIQAELQKDEKNGDVLREVALEMKMIESAQRAMIIGCLLQIAETLYTGRSDLDDADGDG